MKIFGSVIYIVLKDILTVYNIFNRMDYYYKNRSRKQLSKKSPPINFQPTKTLRLALFL